MRKLFGLPLMAAVLAGCAAGQRAESVGQTMAPREPAGDYEIAVELGGEYRSGKLEVIGADPSYQGSLQIPGLPAATVTSARYLSDDQLEIGIRLPEGPATLRLDVEPSGQFTGRLVAGGQQIRVRGRRLQ